MSTILQYAKHLKRLNGVGWRVKLNQPQSEIAGVVHRFQRTHALDLNLTKSYATNAAIKSQSFMQGYNDTAIQQLDIRLKRSGRVSKSNIEKALSETQNTGILSSLDAHFMIKCCGRSLVELENEECIRIVGEVWETCKRLGVLMDVSHYNTLLNVYLEKEHKFSPSTFISTMLENEIEPNRVTYQKLIAAYCMQGDIAGATKLLGIMKDKNVPLCENLFNSLITGHSESNDLQSAVGILKTMETAGIEPSSETYEALLCAYAKHCDIEAIRTTLDELKNTDISLSDAQMLEIFYVLAANGHVAAAEKFMDENIKESPSDCDVGRILVKLIHLKQLPLAMKLLEATSTNPVRRSVRSVFIIKSVIKNPDSTNDVVEICKWFESNRYYDRPFATAIYHSLTSNCDVKITIPLLKAWRESGGEIRPHYFWPLLRSYTKENNYDGMINIIRTMVQEFGLSPCIDTLRDYVIPYMFGTWQDAVAVLTAENVPEDNIYLAIVDRLLLEKKIRNAGMFMTKHPSKYPKEMFLSPLIESFMVRNDSVTFLAALRLLDREPDAIEDAPTPVELINAAVLKVLDILPSYRFRLLNELLHQLMSTGLSISPEVGDEIRTYLQDKLTPDIEEIIKKITSGTLTQLSLLETNPYYYTRKPENDSSLNIAELRASFVRHYETRNVQGCRDILGQMEAAEVRSPAILAQAIHLFCDCGDLEAAEECINIVKSMESMKLDNLKNLQYASLLVKNNRFDDAIQFLSEQLDAGDSAKYSRLLRLQIRSLFNTLAKLFQVENQFQMFNVLKSKKLLEPDAHSLGPLVSAHVERNDLESALKVFERACIEYKCSPYKNVLLKAFIEKEDANSLQKMTDLCTELYGEASALVDLAFIFLECSRPRQAQKILETSCIHVHNNRIAFLIEHLSKVNDMKNLEQFTKITRGVVKMDHGFMFNEVLNVYAQRNLWEKGLALWTDMQEFDVLPTQEFLVKLSSLLKKNNQKVPFVLSDTVSQISNTLSTVDTRKPYQSTRKTPEPSERFDEALLRQDYNLAEREILSSQLSNWHKVGMCGRLITCLLDDGDVDKAFNVATTTIKNYSQFNRLVFARLIGELAAVGKNNDIEALGDILEEHLKKFLKFYKVRSFAQIKTDGIRKFLENMEIHTDSNNPRAFESRIHFGAMVHGLISDPSALPLMKETAQKLFNAGIDRGMHVLWNYYVITNSPEAEQLWTDYVSKSSSPLIAPIIEHATSKRDVHLIKQIIEKIEENPKMGMNAQIKLRTALITIHNESGNHEDALRIVDNVRQRFSLKVLPYKELKKLKANLESSGRNFPYSIPEGQRSDGDTDENSVNLYATKL